MTGSGVGSGVCRSEILGEIGLSRKVPGEGAIEGTDNGNSCFFEGLADD